MPAKEPLTRTTKLIAAVAVGVFALALIAAALVVLSLIPTDTARLARQAPPFSTGAVKAAPGCPLTEIVARARAARW